VVSTDPERELFTSGVVDWQLIEAGARISMKTQILLRVAHEKKALACLFSKRIVYWRGLRLDDIQHVTMIPLVRARFV